MFELRADTKTNAAKVELLTAAVRELRGALTALVADCGIIGTSPDNAEVVLTATAPLVEGVE